MWWGSCNCMHVCSWEGGGLIRETEAAAQGKRSLILRLNVLTCKPHTSKLSFSPCHRPFSCEDSILVWQEKCFFTILMTDYHDWLKITVSCMYSSVYFQNDFVVYVLRPLVVLPLLISANHQSFLSLSFIWNFTITYLLHACPSSLWLYMFSWSTSGGHLCPVT